MSFISDLVGGGDIQDAARAQQQGYDKGQATFEAAGRTATDRFTPYAQTGRVANNRLLQLMNGDFSGFREDPGYQFAFGEGQRALENSASARGMNFSGPQMKALMQYGQGMGDQQYGNHFNRLYQLSNQGMNAAGNQANIDMNTAQGVANMQTGAAGARASGYMAKANIKNALTNNLLGSITDIATGGAPTPGGVG